MRILVTGAAGQLGRDVTEELLRRGHTCIAADLPGAGRACLPLDITDEEDVRRCFTENRPDAVIHCAAWTAVDAAEEPEHLPAVRAVNVLGTKHIAKACRENRCKLLYLSTDYVFGGGGTEPWDADSTAFAPQNVYGQSKLDGETAVREALDEHFIVRTAWVFGIHGKNFVKTMLSLGKTHASVRVVSDQMGRPTYTRDLARLLADLAESDRYGCYHASNEGDYISWYAFAREIFRQAGCSAEVLPVTTAEYGQSKAKRPLNGRLDTGKLVRAGFAPLPPWQDALKRFLEEYAEKGDDDAWDRFK